MITPLTARWLLLRRAALSQKRLQRTFHSTRLGYAEQRGTDDPSKGLVENDRQERPRRKTEKSMTEAEEKGKSKQSARPLPAGIKPEQFKAYTEENKKTLKGWYTPAQLAAIEAGEEAIDTQDLAEQASLRDGPWAFNYVDDFAQIHPVIDKPVRAPKENYDPKLRYKTEDEIVEDHANFIRDLPEKPTRLDYIKFRDNLRLKVGKEEAERNPRNYLAPDIPKGSPELQKYVSKLKEGEVVIEPGMKRLMRQTGYSSLEIKRFRSKVLASHRVVNQTKKGKISSEYCICVAGNGRGLLGIGEGKSTEPGDATNAARYAAIRNMQAIPRYESRTIYGNVKVKIGAVEIELMARPPGFGIRCQPLIYEMCCCVGISDLAARVTRSRNPMNVIKTVYQALMHQKLPDEVARGLGKKLVDVRKVYYGGSLY